MPAFGKTTSLAECMGLRQIIFDDYLDFFAEVIKHATIYLGRRAKFTNYQRLSAFDHRLISPLYFCATKC